MFSKSFSAQGIKIFIFSLMVYMITGCVTNTQDFQSVAQNELSSPDVKSVKGVSMDLTQLSGQWKGQYKSAVTQRGGSVSFDLNASSNEASGFIMMTPKGAEIKVPQLQPLTIDFVGVEEGYVRGDVTPYDDPAFNSIVFTNFEGTLNGNRLEGTFTSRIGQTGDYYTGSWWAIRQ